MDMILCDRNRKPIGIYTANIDMEIGDTEASNDFETSTEDVQFGYSIICPGTEYGGIFGQQVKNTGSTQQTWNGLTWRGLLKQDIIIPPAGNDYRIVSGEANTIIRSLVSDAFGGFFKVPEEDSGLNISSYQFIIYTTLLEGLMDMLAVHNYRLKIWSELGEPNEPYQVYLAAVPVTKNQTEYTDNSKINVQTTDYRMGINHLVCMGSGKLQARQRVDLYVQLDGSISQSKYYTGFDERTAYYDYGNAESLDDLIDNGTKKLQELANYQKLEIVSVEDIDLEIGDIVVGCDRDHGIYIEKPVTRKILTVSSGIWTVDYQIRGEE